MDTLLYLALIISLLLIALFAASEAALAVTNRLRLRHLLRSQNEEGVPGAIAPTSDELSGDTQKFIATVTIAANVPLLIAAVVTMLLITASNTRGVLSGAQSAAIALAIIIFLQIIPRLLVSQPGALETQWWVRPAYVLVAVLRAPVGLLMWMGSTLLQPLGVLKRTARRRMTSGKNRAQNEEEEDKATRDLVEDLVEELVESAQASGTGSEQGRELIESIFSFRDTRVHEVMIPRPDILSLSITDSFEEIATVFKESGYSRLPVQEGGIDHIVGILHVGDLLRFLHENQDGDSNEFSTVELMREPMFIPESQMINHAFTAMRSARTHLAIIIDEFGGTAGLLTVEDILEELVGEIADEHDRDAEEPLLILDDHTAIADALLDIEDLETQWDLSLPPGGFDTIGGFVIEQLGRAPVISDRVELPMATLVVHAVRGRRPHKILIQKTNSQHETPDLN